MPPPWTSGQAQAIVRAYPFVPSSPSTFELIPNGCFAYGGPTYAGTDAGGWATVTATGFVLTYGVDLNWLALDKFVNGVPDGANCKISINGGAPTDVPAAGIYAAGTSFDIWDTWPTSATLESIVQVSVNRFYDPGPPAVTSGIYVGFIVLDSPCA